MRLAPEGPGDAPALRRLVEEAFRPMAFSEGAEGAILDALRARGELLLGLVAWEGDAIVGQAAFSPARVGGTPVVALGPIAVRADRQGRGIGSALVRDGLARLGGPPCVLIGDPGFYGRLGFRGDLGLTHEGVPDPYVQGLGAMPAGEVRFAPGFGARP